jgi:DNA-directed RNA polymerase subunit RPC12/RpoP
MLKFIICSQNHPVIQNFPYWTVYIHKIPIEIMSSGSHPQSQHLCAECGASFFTKEGLEKHFQRQHGIYCETCPIDIAVQKITDIFRKKTTN